MYFGTHYFIYFTFKNLKGCKISSARPVHRAKGEDAACCLSLLRSSRAPRSFSRISYLKNLKHTRWLLHGLLVGF